MRQMRTVCPKAFVLFPSAPVEIPEAAVHAALCFSWDILLKVFTKFWISRPCTWLLHQERRSKIHFVHDERRFFIILLEKLWWVSFIGCSFCPIKTPHSSDSISYRLTNGVPLIYGVLPFGIIDHNKRSACQHKTENKRTFLFSCANSVFHHQDKRNWNFCFKAQASRFEATWRHCCIPQRRSGIPFCWIHRFLWWCLVLRRLALSCIRFPDNRFSNKRICAFFWF